MDAQEGSAPQGLTERQQFWLDHISRCDGGGFSTKHYAATHNLSAQAMYTARRHLVACGALHPGGRGVHTGRFARVQPASSPIGDQVGLPQAVLTVQLNNGAVISVPGPLDAQTLQLVLQTAAALP